ncbi:TVP38/TMEM64 family inner membrane protein YdjZ [Botrimarina colliarenosi]|uniref:TVP38/TMEM64 family membrane protein n=1 Tax=Botrimarina colliarenosi TaxID=2528001 RepID=A0A5C6ALA2_9BACT|nr:TVP38/TMEM64 family protein [Botrimarina colliarenosi]TWU00258.1 TVP38/TMEM64 family inner membrane protein YdjZ [Botrimarina colliarenosi]
MMHAKTWKLAALVALLVGLAAAIRLLPVSEWLSGFLEYLRGLEFWGPALLAVVYVVATVLMVPGLILTLTAGYLFGVALGTCVASVGSVLGATLAFLIGRYAARDFVEGLAKRNPRFAAIDSAVARQGWKIVLLTRLSPAFPFNALNYLYGATPVSLRDYFFASWIGMLPATVLYVYLGAATGNLTDLLTGKVEGGAARQALLVVGLIATVAVTVFVTRIAKRALSEVAPSAAEPVVEA